MSQYMTYDSFRSKWQQGIQDLLEFLQCYLCPSGSQVQSLQVGKDFLTLSNAMGIYCSFSLFPAPSPKKAHAGLKASHTKKVMFLETSCTFYSELAVII